MNKAILVGHIGRDPELKTNSEGHVCNFSLATNDAYKNEKGEVIRTVEWHDIALWNREKLASILKQGMLVELEGAIKNRTYERQVGGEPVKIKATWVDAARLTILSAKQTEEGPSSED